MRKLTHTTTEAQLRGWLAEGEGAQDIAERLGVHSNYVYVTLALLGLTHTHRADAQAFYRLLVAGKNPREIGEALGFTRRTVEKTLKQAGLPTCAREYWRRQAKNNSEFSSGAAAPLRPPAAFQGAVGGLSVSG